MSVTKATGEQTTNLAIYLQSQAVTPEQSIQWLKAKSYTVRSTHFEAVRVANIIQGINIGIHMATPTPKKARARKPVYSQADEIPF